MNTSFEFNLSQAEKLELASIGTREESPAITPPPYAYAPLRDKIKARDMNPRLSASRFHDDDEWETDAGLAILGDDGEENERTYASHVLPSARNRGAVYAELKGMGYAWAE